MVIAILIRGLSKHLAKKPVIFKVEIKRFRNLLITLLNKAGWAVENLLKTRPCFKFVQNSNE